MADSMEALRLEEDGARMRLQHEVAAGSEGKVFKMRFGDEVLRDKLLDTLAAEDRARVPVNISTEDTRGIEEDGYRILSRQQVEAILGKFRAIYTKGYRDLETESFTLRSRDRVAYTEDGRMLETVLIEEAERLREIHYQLYQYSRLPSRNVFTVMVDFPIDSSIPEMDRSLGEADPKGAIRSAINRRHDFVNSEQLLEALFIGRQYELREVEMTVNDDGLSASEVNNGDICVALLNGFIALPFTARGNRDGISFPFGQNVPLGACLKYKGSYDDNSIYEMQIDRKGDQISYHYTYSGPKRIDDDGTIQTLGEEHGSKHTGGSAKDGEKTFKLFKVVKKGS